MASTAFRTCLIILAFMTTLNTQPLLAQTGTDSDQGKPDRRSTIDIMAMFFTDFAADTVYTYLYKLGLMAGLDIGYSYYGRVLQHKITVTGGAGRLVSPYVSEGEYTAVDDLVFQIEMRYALIFPVLNAPGKSQQVQLFLGPSAHFYLNGWIPDSEEVNVLRYAWNVHTGLGLHTQLELPFNKQRQKLIFGLYIPVVGIAWRPTYATYTLKEETLLETEGMMAAIFSNASFVSFHNFFSVSLRMTYEQKLSRFFYLKISYLGKFEYINIPRERIDIQNSIGAGIAIKF